MKKQMIEIFRYGISGVTTTIINLYLLKVFIDFGMYYILANIISYIIGVIINYILNQKYVFSDSARGNTIEAKKQFIKFLIMRIISLIIDTLLFYVAVSIFNFPVYWSRLILTIVMILATFILNKWFIFVGENKKISKE